MRGSDVKGREVATGSSPTTTTRALSWLGAKGGRTLAVRLDALRHRGFSSLFQQRTAFRSSSLSARFHEARSVRYRQIWEHAAATVGADLQDLGDEFLVLAREGASTLVRQHLVAFDDAATMALTGDKALVHRLLDDEGLPVPEHVETHSSNLAPAHDFLAQVDGPFVVKPAEGTGGGAGVTGSVESPDDLARVCLAAGKWGTRLLVERTLVGNEYRLLFLDGELIDATLRKLPTVRGDGVSTIAALVLAENERRVRADDRGELRAIRMDLDLELTLRRSGYSLGSVLPAEKSVQVKTAVSENAQADNATVHDLSPALVHEAARAARAVHLRLAGVDLVTPDPSRSLTEAGGAIIEVNSPAGLHYHYLVATPEEATPVAVPILERLLDEARGTQSRPR